MVKRIGIKPTVMMTGGVAKNSGVIAAFRKELNIDVVVPTNMDPQLVGALGAALGVVGLFSPANKPSSQD